MCAHPGSGTAEVAATSASITSLSTSRRPLRGPASSHGAPSAPADVLRYARTSSPGRSERPEHRLECGAVSGPARTDAPRRLEEHVTGAGANRHRIRDRRSRLLTALLPAAVLLLLSGCTLQPVSNQAGG